MLIIRQYKEEDVQYVASLINQLGYPSSISQLQNRMKNIDKNPSYTTFVAEQDAMVVGIIGLRELFGYEYDNAVMQISHLVTDEKVRGKGIGKALVNHAENFAKEMNCSALFLHSGMPRIEAHEFYKHIGFTVTGLRFVKQL